MPDLEWLDEYSGQTTDELIALEGKYRVDSLVSAFEQAMQQKAARVGKTHLSEEERIILAVEALEREVNNGGYEQFFVNSSSEYTSVIADALRRIGCPKVADLSQKALKIVVAASGGAEDFAHGVGKLSEEDIAALGECDGSYYEGSEDIGGRLFEFIKANRDKIKP